MVKRIEGEGFSLPRMNSKMNLILIATTGISLFAANSVLSLSSSTMETSLNEESLRTFKQLEKNYKATLKEIDSAPSKGLFASMKSFVFSGKTKSAINPQDDLNELAQIYGALNSADISVLYYLRKHCGRNNTLIETVFDPNLCLEYPDILTKSVQNRLGVINSWVMHSIARILSSPPRWLYHAMTASELMLDVDPINVMEYRVQQAVISSAAPKEFEDFKNNPNIMISDTVNSNYQDKEPLSATENPDMEELKDVQAEEKVKEHEKIIELVEARESEKTITQNHVAPELQQPQLSVQPQTVTVQPEKQSQAQPESQPQTQTQLESLESKSQSQSIESQSQTQTESKAESTPESTPESQSQPQLLESKSLESKTESQKQPQLQTQPQQESQTQPQQESQPQPKLQSIEPQSRPQCQLPDSNPESHSQQHQQQQQSQPQSQPQAQPQAQSMPQPQTQPESQTRSIIDEPQLSSDEKLSSASQSIVRAMSPPTSQSAVVLTQDPRVTINGTSSQPCDSSSSDINSGVGSGLFIHVQI